MAMQEIITDLLAIKGLCKEVHWNARGQGFIAVHSYLDTVDYDCELYVDELAEHMASVQNYGLPKFDVGTFETFPQLLIRDRALITGVRDIVMLLEEFVDRLDEFLANSTDDPAGEDIVVRCYQSFNKHLWQLSSELG